MRQASRIRAIASSLALIVLLSIIGVWVSLLVDDPAVLPPIDFVEYWAAGKLNLAGKNPYDHELLYPLERFEAGRASLDEQGPTAQERAVMMWNPPWTLTLAMPLGALPPRAGQWLWLGTSLLIACGCSIALWRLFGGRKAHAWMAVPLAFAFLPLVRCLYIGQISAWILLGVTLFLAGESRGRSLLAGAGGVLMAIKPHLVYLFWPALLWWSFRDRRGWKIVASGIAIGAICTLIPIAFNPPVFGQYWEAARQHPPQFETPTIGAFLRRIEGSDSFAVQLSPMFLGGVWLAARLWKMRAAPWSWRDEMPMILLVSFVTAPYGAWPFDMLVLLPLVVDVAVRVNWQPTRANLLWSGAAWLVFSLCFFLPILVTEMTTEVDLTWLTLATPVLAVEYILLRRILPAR